MNLWVKRTGQFLMAVLFLMSCQDDSFLLGFRNQNKKFNLRYQEFTLPSSVVLIDSLITDNSALGNFYRLLVGQYQDTRFGTVRAEAYTQIQPTSVSKLDASSVYDSVTLQLSLDLYSYGWAGTSEEKFTVHKITEDSLTFTKRYYYNSSIGYDPAPLAEASYTVIYDSLQTNLSRTAPDTFLVNVRLDDAYGLELFALALDDPAEAFSDDKQFRNIVKGLALIPSESNMIAGFSILSSLSKVTLHYHTSTDTLERAFFVDPFNTTSFTKITTTRTGDLAAIIQPYESYVPPSELRYLQNGSPVITQLDISGYNNFIKLTKEDGTDSLENLILNSAELSIESVESPPSGLPPPSTLVFRIMNMDDLFVNSVIDADSAAVSGFYVLNSGKYYFPGSDLVGSSSEPIVTLRYDETTNSYSGFITLFMQNLFDRKQVETEIQFLGLDPVSPAPGKSVDRAVFNQNSVKLKLYYTDPAVISNPQ